MLFFGSCKKDSETPANRVPVANAGSPVTITLPANTVTLNGSGTDEDGQVVAYLWSQVSGPAPAAVSNPGSPSTQIKNLSQGTFTFQLMVTDDKGATGVATVSVVVSPSPVTTLTLQPAKNPNEYLIINHNGVDKSGGGVPDLPVEAWTHGGTPYTVRALIKFDLSSIPTNATILSANLYLYSYPSPTLNGNFIDANLGSNNSMLVQQITSSWSPGSVNWSNQPSVTTTNQVVVTSTTQQTLDLNLDVKNMVSSMTNGNANHGFFLKIQNEVFYNCRIFVASHNTTHTTKYPKLVVMYQ